MINRDDRPTKEDLAAAVVVALMVMVLIAIGQHLYSLL